MVIADIGNGHVLPVDSENLAIHENSHEKLETVGRGGRLFFCELCIPFRENDGDYRSAVMEGVVVKCNGLALLFQLVETVEHFVNLAP